jgi:hypothetical protein
VSSTAERSISYIDPECKKLTSLCTVFQTIGGAFSVSASQSGFVNRLISTLAYSAPEVDPQLVVATGATQIRSSFSPDQVLGIVFAYMAGVKVSFALVVGLAGFAFLVALLVPWKRINAESLKESAGGIA